MIDHELLREFETIKETRFWREYQEKILCARKNVVQLLCTNRIDEQAVRGDIWQDNLKLIDRILKAPDKMIGTENPD